MVEVRLQNTSIYGMASNWTEAAAVLANNLIIGIVYVYVIQDKCIIIIARTGFDCNSIAYP